MRYGDSCDFCAYCPRKYHPLSANGPQPCDILAIGERPGKDENRIGIPFVGKSGQELDQTYLPLAHLSRSTVRVTNAVRCWADNDRTPTPKEIAECSRHHLPAELEATQPKVILLLGSSALKLATSSTPLQLDTHHGFPQQARLFDWQGTIVPLYHPALGMHESRFMTQLLEDWSHLLERLDGASLTSQLANNAPSHVPDYQLTTSPAALRAYLRPYWSRTLGLDTEDHAGTPWSVQLSAFDYTGRLLLAADKPSLAHLATLLADPALTWVLHNAPHDLAILAKLGMYPHHVRDTMQESFHQGNLPQGLKPLVYRLFGHTLKSWDDTVRPFSIEALTTWTVEALHLAQKDLSLIEVRRLKTKVREVTKRGPLEQLLDRILTHTSSPDYDPWERLTLFWSDPANEWMISHIETRLGHFPLLGIGNVPLDRAIRYACGDADWTLQTAHELARRRRIESWAWAIEPDDKDA